MKTVTISGLQVTRAQLEEALAKFDEPDCFYEKQLVYCWDNNATHGAVVRFWDVKHSRPYGYRRGCEGETWDNYSSTLPSHMNQFNE